MWRLFAPRAQRIAREQVSLQLPDGRQVEVLQVRHPRARRLKLSVDERGARLTLPPRASLRSAQDFLHDHRDWLASQLNALADAGALPLQPWQPMPLPLRGIELPVHWQAGATTRVDLAEDAVRFQVRGQGVDAQGHAAPVVRRALRDFYEAQARADVARWLPRYLPELPRPPARIVLRAASTQWGSLSPGGVLTLDPALVLAPADTFEYVLVHELCHLLHADHSPAFWRAVAARCPGWRQHRRWLQQQGRPLKARWRMLVSVCARH